MNRGRGSQAHFSDALDLMRQFEIDPATVFVNFGRFLKEPSVHVVYAELKWT